MSLSRPRLSAPAALFGTALLLAACGAEGDKKADGTSKADAATAPAANTDTAQPAPAPTTEAKAAPAASGPNLSAYVGKYPFEAVDGVAFKDHPLVKAGIAKTVTNARIRTAITTTPGPSAPIATVDGKIASWSCQQHNCGEHQWAILIDPATGATDVCYQNDPAMVSETRWFLADGKEEKRKGDCGVDKQD